MWRYSLQRLGAALLVAWLAMSLAFVALRLVPGDAVDATLERAGVPAQEVRAEKERLGLAEPLWKQYVSYLAGIARGDWGESLVSQQPVSEIVGQNLAPTMTLAVSALLIAMTLGVGLGICAGTAQRGIVRYSVEAMTALSLSVPVYLTAMLAIYLFTIELDVLPGVGGRGIRYLILPAGILGFHTAGSIAQVTASSIREASGQDFVRTARAKGLSEFDVLDHILRVALLPVLAVVALQLGFLLGGTVITEMIFVRRGLGGVLLLAISNRDYPVIQGLVALSALIYSLINGIADIIYGFVDPRVTRVS